MAMTGQATATEAEVEKGIRGKLVENLKAVVADAEELLKATEDYVRANPWKAVGIAAGAGFVLCLLATRLGQSVIEAGERMIIKGGRAIQVAEKEVQKLFK